MSADPFMESFNVPAMGMILIILFYSCVGLILFGPQIADDVVFGFLLVFLSLGTAFLIGKMGWIFLALPAIVVIIIFVIQRLIYFNNKW